MRLVIALFKWIFRINQPDVEAILKSTKKVRINGITFHIKKLDPFSHLAGFNTMHSIYTTYNESVGQVSDHKASGEKIKKHYAEILKAGVCYPILADEPGPGALDVNVLLQNMEVCEFLYCEILEFTYGKKKLRKLGYQRKGF